MLPVLVRAREREARPTGGHELPPTETLCKAEGDLLETRPRDSGPDVDSGDLGRGSQWPRCPGLANEGAGGESKATPHKARCRVWEEEVA